MKISLTTSGAAIDEVVGISIYTDGSGPDFVNISALPNCGCISLFMHRPALEQLYDHIGAFLIDKEVAKEDAK